MLRRAIAAGLLSISGCAFSQGLTPIFSVYLANSVLCHNVADMGKILSSMVAQAGQPVRTEGGAYWWTQPLSIRGAVTGTEIFVAQDVDPGYQFVGIRLPQTPPQVAQTLSAAGMTFFQAPRAGPYDPWYSHSGSTLLWDQMSTKMVCIWPTGPWRYVPE